MHRAYRFFISLFLTLAVAAPMAMMAVPMPQSAGVQIRIYDRGHKDYHNWDDHENQAWVQYQSDNHRKAHEFKKANRREQSQYWNYRHSHPDKN